MKGRRRGEGRNAKSWKASTKSEGKGLGSKVRTKASKSGTKRTLKVSKGRMGFKALKGERSSKASKVRTTASKGNEELFEGYYSALVPHSLSWLLAAALFEWL